MRLKQPCAISNIMETQGIANYIVFRHFLSSADSILFGGRPMAGGCYRRFPIMEFLASLDACFFASSRRELNQFTGFSRDFHLFLHRTIQSQCEVKKDSIEKSA